MEVGEGVETEAGFDDALDDVGRFRGFGWSPVVGDGFGDAAELDDGEFAGEFALEGIDAAAGWEMVMGMPRDCQNQDSRDYRIIRMEIVREFWETRSFPLIFYHLSRAFGGSWG